MHWHSIDLPGQVLSLGSLALVIIWAASSNRQARQRKEMEHAERMKAMELGLAPQPYGLTWPAASICIAVGAGVPVGSFVVAWLAILTADAPPAIFVAPVFVSVAALNATRKLALRLIDPKAGVIHRPSSANAAPVGKPEYDPDAFDVVGRRG
jgi:hypothetical protein